MPYKNKAEKAAYNKQYNLANKEKSKQYRLDNKEKLAVQKKQRHIDNHRKITIKSWTEKAGLIHDDYDALYDEYLLATSCNICNIELTTGKVCKTLKVMDHCHDTGLFRQFLCSYCNWRLID
jgi:hypothetical protein